MRVNCARRLWMEMLGAAQVVKRGGVPSRVKRGGVHLPIEGEN